MNRYENTYNALRDCQEDLDNTAFFDLSESENKYRSKLIEVCRQITDKWDYEIEKLEAGT